MGKDSPAARNRYLFADGEFNLLPRSLSKMILNPPKILKGVARELIREPFQAKSTLADESVEQFLTRRLGPIVGSTLGSAMVRGIYSGDSRTLSMRAAFGSIWQMEQNFGSITGGIVNSIVSPSKVDADYEIIKTMKKEILESDPRTDSILNSSMIGFDGGIETISKAITDKLSENPNVEFVLNSDCQSIHKSQVDLKNIRVKYSCATEPLPKFKDFDHVFVAAPSNQASKIIDPRLVTLPDIPWSDVAVVNVSYKHRQDLKRVIPFEGFGYLVPRSQPSLAIGVVFDSCSFPSLHPHYETLTLMIGKDQMTNKTKDELINLSLQCLKEQMNIDREPDLVDANLNHSCIPLYPVGHVESMKQVKEQLIQSKHITLLGNSYTGVSVNDCISNAEQLATNYFEGSVLNNQSQTYTGLEKF